MPTEPIPFVNAQRSGLQELGGAAPIAFNVVADLTGTIRRRPGIQTTDLASSAVVDAGGIVGLYVTLGGILFAVGGTGATSKPIYRFLGGTAMSVSTVPAERLDGAGRPVIAETEMLLVLAAGGTIQKVELATYASSLLGGTPPEASHVVAQNLRLIANDVVVDKTKVNYSDQAIGTTSFAGHETWPTSAVAGGGFFTAEARPDPVVAIHENTNEVFVWGSNTLQVFAPDGTLVYAPVASRETGCAAPYSIIKADESFAWLDDKRRFVMSDGRGIEGVGGDAIKRDLDAMTTVDDCFGYRVLMGTVDALVWTFPTDGRTYAFQQGVGWGQWSTRSGGLWGQMPITAHHLQSGTGKNLVGTSDGRIGELSFEASSDLGGDVVSAHVTTGFLDRGTSMKKRCAAVRLTLRRGEASGEPTGLLSWRDGLGEWESPIPVSLGRSGDFETTVTFYSLGVYRTRQWRFEFDSEATLVLVKVEEDFEVLEG